MQVFQILGQSNYAMSIIVDTLYNLYGTDFSAEIYSNIPNSENDSIEYPFEIPGVEAKCFFHDAFHRKEATSILTGSIGKSRAQIVNFFDRNHGVKNIDYDNLIHPSANLPHQLKLGRGINISPGVTIAPFVELGDLTVLNRNTSIGHHTIISEFATINPGCTIAGVCRIGKGVTIGAGATILDKIEIGDHSVIGAGSVVTKNIPANVIAYGVPAKVIRKLKA